MKKIDWASKLTSRKFWAAIIGFITSVMIVFNVDTLTIEQSVALISAASTLIAYIIGEGMVDAARIAAASEATALEPLVIQYPAEMEKTNEFVDGPTITYTTNTTGVEIKNEVE